jgi:hypothetical protein
MCTCVFARMCRCVSLHLCMCVCARAHMRRFVSLSLFVHAHRIPFTRLESVVDLLPAKRTLNPKP